MTTTAGREGVMLQTSSGRMPLPSSGGARNADAQVPRISVIIPAKNEARRIANVLQALRAQTIPPFEVIVVDGRSTDGTVRIAEENGARVLFEDAGTRAGACQVGLEAARGDFVAFTDADCVPDPQWLERLIPHLSANCAGVGGRVLNEGGSFWQRAIDSALDTMVGSANSIQGRTFREGTEVYSISGCNSMYVRRDLLAIGGFRTDLVTAEDTELNRRIRRWGAILLYIPDAIVRHRHGRGLRAFGRRMFQYGRGRGQIPLLGAPVVLPLALPFPLVVGFFSPLASLALVGAYGLLLTFTGLAVATRARERRYVWAIPVVLLVEHVCYAAGFWAGAGSRLTSRPLRGKAARGPSP